MTFELAGREGRQDRSVVMVDGLPGTVRVDTEVAVAGVEHWVGVSREVLPEPEEQLPVQHGPDGRRVARGIVVVEQALHVKLGCKAHQ